MSNNEISIYKNNRIKKEDPKKADPKKSDKAPAPPAAPKLIKFKVTVPADTPLGIHDVRISGKAGISNSRAFQVTDLNEINEKDSFYFLHSFFLISIWCLGCWW